MDRLVDALLYRQQTPSHDRHQLHILQGYRFLLLGRGQVPERRHEHVLGQVYRRRGPVVDHIWGQRGRTI